MKKSCFIQAVVIFTILIAVIIYVIQYKLEDWFIKPGKKFLISEAVKNLDNEVSYIQESVQKDSLKSLMKYYFENIKTMEEVVNLDEEIFINEFDAVIEDSILTDEEISKLTMLLKREEYEKSKSDRN
jgi:hypothetical protein